jgi:multidrug resistance efflux pump
MAMDKPRTNKPKKKGPIYIGIGLFLVAGITVGLSQLEPAAPSVDVSAQVVDTVRRGPLVKAVRGPGTLVPEQIRYITAVTAGRVEEIYARPGALTTPTTPLLRLSNPDIDLRLLDAERQLSAAKSDLIELTASLKSAELSQEASVANYETQYNQAQRDATVANELVAKNLITKNEAAQANERFAELKRRVELEKQRLEVAKTQGATQISAQREQIDRLNQVVAYQRDQIASMRVTAGTDGVLQLLQLEVGQWVNAGFEVARVVRPERLKAVLRIPENQAVDVVIGQVANINTRNGIVQGHVVRIDPASTNGTVGVDIALPEQLPPGARPDLGVDGDIEITRLEDVLYVGRPPFGGPNTTIGLFKLDPGGKGASLVTVQLGVTSVNHVEVKSGLKEGDAVILSDMTAWQNYDRLRLKY